MTVRIGFLRAVNVGRRRVAMARLREVTEGLGHTDVWTHVNSGNVVLDATGRRDALEQALEAAYQDAFGFECTTFVRTAAEVENVLAATPFEVGDGDTHFVTFLKAAPSAAVRRDLEALSNEFDTLVVDGRDVHWLMHGKSTDTKIPKRDWERILGKDSSTSRNTTMLRGLMTKLAARA